VGGATGQDADSDCGGVGGKADRLIWADDNEREGVGGVMERDATGRLQ
jgi:hypothetical protein